MNSAPTDTAQPRHLFTDGYCLLRKFARKYLRNCGREADVVAVDKFILYELPSFTEAAQETLTNDLNARHRAS